MVRAQRAIEWSDAITRRTTSRICGASADDRVASILIVDDRPDARYAMVRPLAAAGFDVRETVSGRDALRFALLSIHLIVLDLILPYMAGCEVLRRLKADPATRNIPVVVKTAFPNGDEDRRRALNAGAAAYFTDTDDPHALVAVVRGVLRDARH